MVFSQGSLVAPALDNGPKPTPAQVQDLVDALQKASRALLPISVVKNPSEIDGIPVDVAPGSNPTGGVVGGRIYLFTDNLRSRGEVLVTIFHELFHLGLVMSWPGCVFGWCWPPIRKIVLHPPLHRTGNKKACYQIDSRLSL